MVLSPSLTRVCKAYINLMTILFHMLVGVFSPTKHQRSLLDEFPRVMIEDEVRSKTAPVFPRLPGAMDNWGGLLLRVPLFVVVKANPDETQFVGSPQKRLLFPGLGNWGCWLDGCLPPLLLKNNPACGTFGTFLRASHEERAYCIYVTCHPAKLES